MRKVRPIAIYLPQFHPVPENDEWWGKGFTEWTNVSKAKPRFRGHYQPHFPADLGFYDLRLPEVRQAQADLARQYGIYGFCYYHYWFNGRRILERPFQEVFESGRPDFPFMLCWANENWTRIWDGSEREVLLKQEYSEEDDIAHISALIPYFRDERYIKVDGKPVFAFYKDALLPDIAATVKTFRAEAKKAGIELYLCKFDRNQGTHSGLVAELGFDAAIEFQPFSPSLNEFNQRLTFGSKYLQPRRYVRYLKHRVLHICDDSIYDYREFVDFDLKRSEPDYKCFPCIMPSWDNSSRRADASATIFKHSSPAYFKKWASGKLKQFMPYSSEENLFFINAWNEWAEGNHLEPDQRWGRQYLEALRDSLKEHSYN